MILSGGTGMENKYFEVEFARYIGDFGDYTSDYSICIIGEREPTTEEATEFCKEDLQRLGYDFVSNVFPLSSEEAHNFFDMENEEAFPIFS